MAEVRARIKFKDGLPYKLQKHVTDKYGFMFEARKFNEWLILKKYKMQEIGQPPARGTAVLLVGTTVNDRIQLGRQCQAIKASFHDPVASAAMIRFRIQEMCRPLNHSQKEWCEGWITRNVNAL